MGFKVEIWYFWNWASTLQGFEEEVEFRNLILENRFGIGISMRLIFNVEER
jgi:hypothetical protein